MSGSPGPAGVSALVKVPCLVAGMIAGADSIDDMDLLRHGAMPALFAGSGPRPRWARSCGLSPGETCSQLAEKVSRVLLADLARRVPLLPGKDTVGVS